VEGVLAEAKKALESNDGDKMKSALEDLSKAGAEFYADAQAAAKAAEAGASGHAADAGAHPKAEKKADVVDADFEVVDEEKSKK